mgnify:FL=1
MSKETTEPRSTYRMFKISPKTGDRLFFGQVSHANPNLLDAYVVGESQPLHIKVYSNQFMQGNKIALLELKESTLYNILKDKQKIMNFFEDDAYIPFGFNKFEVMRRQLLGDRNTHDIDATVAPYFH